MRMKDFRSFLRGMRRSGTARMATAGLAAASVAILAALSTGPAMAQSWPQRTVKFVLPFGAGSATDVAARMLGDRLSATWGKPVVIENRPGGDGLIAINAFVSANDDHVLLYSSSASFIAHPYLHEKLPYDLDRDFEPIARVTDTILSVAVPAASDIRTVADFVKLARAEPQKVNVVGAAGVPEFVVSAFLKQEKLDATKIPYRDVVQAGRDLAEGRIQFLLSSYAVVAPLVDAGKVRVIAVAAREPVSLLPGIPSVVQAGYPGLIVETTAGLYGPKGMPRELRERLGKDVVTAAADPGIVAKISASGQVVKSGGPDDLAKAIRQQKEEVAAVAKVLGIEKK
jgi:tripartite-type tricarboxylate transporter receptor subunit TctC